MISPLYDFQLWFMWTLATVGAQVNWHRRAFAPLGSTRATLARAMLIFPLLPLRLTLPTSHPSIRIASLEPLAWRVLERSTMIDLICAPISPPLELPNIQNINRRIRWPLELLQPLAACFHSNYTCQSLYWTCSVSFSWMREHKFEHISAK